MLRTAAALMLLLASGASAASFDIASGAAAERAKTRAGASRIFRTERASSFCGASRETHWRNCSWAQDFASEEPYFGYANGNPIRHTDPDGRFVLCLIEIEIADRDACLAKWKRWASEDIVDIRGFFGPGAQRGANEPLVLTAPKPPEVPSYDVEWWPEPRTSGLATEIWEHNSQLASDKELNRAVRAYGRAGYFALREGAEFAKWEALTFGVGGALGLVERGLVRDIEFGARSSAALESKLVRLENSATREWVLANIANTRRVSNVREIATAGRSRELGASAPSASSIDPAATVVANEPGITLYHGTSSNRAAKIVGNEFYAAQGFRAGADDAVFFAEDVQTAEFFANESLVKYPVGADLPKSFTVLEFKIPRPVAQRTGLLQPETIGVARDLRPVRAGLSDTERVLSGQESIDAFNEALKAGVIKQRRLKVR